MRIEAGERDRLRVLMTADAMGGVWLSAVELCGALAPLGVEVVLATMGREPNAGQRQQIAPLENVTLFTSSYQLEWMIEPWRDVDAAGRWLLSLADEMEVDAVHLNGYVHAALPWRVPVVVNAQTCVCSWWAAVRREEPPPHWDRYRERVRAGVQAAHSVVGPTRAALASVERFYGALRDARVIYPCRQPETFRPRLKEPVVMSAGALWDQARNVAALDAIAP